MTNSALPEQVLDSQTNTRNKGKKWLLISLFILPLLFIIPAIAINFTARIETNNPAENFYAARDTERKSEIATILYALSLYKTSSATGLEQITDGRGNPIPQCPNTGKILANNSPAAGYNEFDLGSVLSPEYLAEFPEDPNDKTKGGDSGYTICTDGLSTTISAPAYEGENPISITR